jgi:DNA-binding transcriptional ArsR family regulator
MISFNRMVEHSINLDMVFGSLADSTRRDILRRVSKRPLSISQLAKPYNMSFAAIAKHIGVLEDAHLVKKRREGKRQMISIAPKAISIATSHLKSYEKMWNNRFEALDELLERNQ